MELKDFTVKVMRPEFGANMANVVAEGPAPDHEYFGAFFGPDGSLSWTRGEDSCSIEDVPAGLPVQMVQAYILARHGAIGYGEGVRADRVKIGPVPSARVEGVL